MKKDFLSPEAQIIVLQVKDIVTASIPGEDTWGGGIGDGDDIIEITDGEVGE